MITIFCDFHRFSAKYFFQNQLAVASPIFSPNFLSHDIDPVHKLPILGLKYFERVPDKLKSGELQRSKNGFKCSINCF
jgi:hypothetical protein